RARGEIANVGRDLGATLRLTRRALAVLLERQLGHDLMWTQRDLRALKELGALTATLAPLDELQEQTFASVRRWITGRPVEPLTATTFALVVEKARTDLRGLVPRLVDLLREILTLRQDLLVLSDPPPGLARDLAALVPANFIGTTPYAQLAHFPRYLKAMKLRAERARNNLAKDAERVAQLAPYEKALSALNGGGVASRPVETARPTAEQAAARESFRWLLEEFRVSQFAQELGTAEPVSTVKLDRALAALKGAPESARTVAAPAPVAKPILAAPVATGKKLAPLKNLGALDKLFPK
ncbi:MAG: DUF3418 domain-containing protein, partial [Verrucomicrobiota bacterium]